MAISKEHKNEMVEQYKEWVNNSRAMVVTEYTGLNMKQLDDLRSKVREAGGEFHVIKNTLTKVAFVKPAGKRAKTIWRAAPRSVLPSKMPPAWRRRFRSSPASRIS